MKVAGSQNDSVKPGWRAQRFVSWRLAPTLLALGVCVWARPLAAQPVDVPASGQTPSASAATQAPADLNPGAFKLSGGVDFLNQYMFRGIRQNSTGLVIWPSDLAIAAYSGNGGLKSVGVNMGTWNSLHTGDTGTNGPSTKLWYESDFYTTLALGFGDGVSLSTTCTAYTSPKLDTAPGLGQADAGDQAGTYLELGVAPGYAGSRASVAVPVKVGLSLSNYYELQSTDHTFGFLNVAGIVTVPLGPTTKFGSWNVHGGAEFQKLGDTTKFINGGDGSQVIGSIGVGFSY
jgi:hypothetical protein